MKAIFLSCLGEIMVTPMTLQSLQPKPKLSLHETSSFSRYESILLTNFISKFCSVKTVKEVGMKLQRMALAFPLFFLLHYKQTTIN
jgi:hypothetical protein